jgi:nitrogen PTS system EIIA component
MQLTVRDLARFFGVADKTIYRWLAGRGLPGYRIGEQYRFNRAEVLEWATSNRVNVAPEIFDEPELPGTPLPGLDEALEAGGISYRVGGRTRDEALRSLVGTLRLSEAVDPEFLYQVLRARELLGSTGVGDGVAIPHVRNPLVLHVPRPMVALGFLEQPVDYDALDGEPVSVLFTILSPTVRAHLQLLSRIAYALRDRGFRRSLKQQGSREEIIKEARRVEGTIGERGLRRVRH